MQEVNHELSPAKARQFLEELLGSEVTSSDFYNLVTRGVLVPIPETRPRRFTEHAVRAVAQKLQEIEKARREQSDTLGTQDALQYLRTRGIEVERGRFRSTLARLVNQRKIDPPQTIPYPSRPHFRFQKETLDVVAQTLNNEATAGLLSTRQAAQHLSEKYGRVVSPDLIYHKIRRKALTPDLVTEDGHYYFAKETLDAVDVGTQRQTKKAAEPVTNIKYISDIKKLEQELGAELLTGAGVLKILRERTGRKYTSEAIKQARRRGTLHPVAQLGRLLLYRKSDAETMRVLPRTGRKVERRTEEDQAIAI